MIFQRQQKAESTTTQRIVVYGLKFLFAQECFNPYTNTHAPSSQGRRCAVVVVTIFPTSWRRGQQEGGGAGGLLVRGLAHMGQNVGQLLALPLGTDVRAEASLQELERTLILRHLQQFHTALLVRGMTDDLTHQIAHELGVLGLDLCIPGGERDRRRRNWECKWLIIALNWLEGERRSCVFNTSEPKFNQGVRFGELNQQEPTNRTLASLRPVGKCVLSVNGLMEVSSWTN